MLALLRSEEWPCPPLEIGHYTPSRNSCLDAGGGEGPPKRLPNRSEPASVPTSTATRTVHTDRAPEAATCTGEGGRGTRAEHHPDRLRRLWLLLERLDDLDALRVERDENGQRKEPTISEKVALAEAIEARLPKRDGIRHDTAPAKEIFPELKGQNRDIAAAKAGLGSGKTLEAAQKVVERNIPERGLLNHARKGAARSWAPAAAPSFAVFV